MYYTKAEVDALIAGLTLCAVTQLTIDSTTSVPVETPLVTRVGQTYLIEASGTYTYAGVEGIADAEWLYGSPGLWYEEFPPEANYPPETLDLIVNNAPRDWLGSTDGENWAPHTFSPNHVYRLYVVGDGQPLSFYINDLSYDWNKGSLTVRISEAKGPRKQ